MFECSVSPLPVGNKLHGIVMATFFVPYVHVFFNNFRVDRDATQDLLTNF